MLTLSVIVPAHNEQNGLPATLEALLRQTVRADQIIVVDDGSVDRTSEVAQGYGVQVVRSPQNLGSKAKAQNYALPYCHTDLVLAVDADTVLADDYIEKIKPAFDNPSVMVAAGCVQSRFERTWTERGRSIEYLYGFHWNRPIQNLANSPTVCSGCCSAFRLGPLVEFGGFPERTIVEDMDYTWSMQMMGHRAVYVAGAVAWAADPENLTYLRKQDWRWMAGFAQNVRLHLLRMIPRKPVLALWILLALWEIVTAPLWLAVPFVAPFLGTPWMDTLGPWVGLEIGLTLPPLLYAAKRRKIPIIRVLRNFPCVYLMKFVNIYYAWKALAVELLLVPLGFSQGLTVYEKGRPDLPPALATAEGCSPQ
jgi:cellulose synthase/poly-beta-1,6-N-acetylglucosamine synthase-like glycosyltransferase